MLTMRRERCGNKFLQCLPLKFDWFLTGIEIHVDKRVDLGLWFSWSYFFFPWSYNSVL